MLAFQTLIKRLDSSYEWTTEALYKLPAELTDEQRLKEYLRIDKSGWSKTDFGYRSFAIENDSGDLYIFPSLIIKDEPAPRKRFPDYKAAFSKQQIEIYAVTLVGFVSDQQAKVNEKFNLLVHDLRSLSTAIYHSSEEARAILQVAESGYPALRDVKLRIEEIIGLQTMLKIRTDVLDYEGSPQVYGERSNVPIYKRVDKVVRSFRSIAQKKGITIHKQGSSFRDALGPDVFEIIAYLLIENAVKYSPRNNDITVNFAEAASKLTVTIISVGPTITIDEIDNIFERGVRGKFPRSYGIPGSGAGLFLAANLIKAFDGNISVESSSRYFIDQREMSDIKFILTVPLLP